MTSKESRKEGMEGLRLTLCQSEIFLSVKRILSKEIKKKNFLCCLLRVEVSLPLRQVRMLKSSLPVPQNVT